MSLRNTGGLGGVSTLDNLNGNVQLVQGPGMIITDNPATNSIKFSTASQAVTLDGVLQNGNSTTRSINLLTNATDTYPAVALHNTIDFGNSSASPDVSLMYSNESPSGLKVSPGKIFRADTVGASIASAIQSKSGINLDPGLTLKTDYIDSATIGGKVNITGLQVAAGSTIYVDSIMPNPTSPTRFINTAGLNVDPAYSVKASSYLPSGSFTNATALLADQGVISSAGSIELDPNTSVNITANKLLKCDVVTSATDSNDKLTFNMPAGIIGASNILLNPVNSVKVLAGKPINCDQIIDTTSTKMVVDLSNTTIQASQDILQSDTQIQNFKTANISGLNADSGITINAPIGGVGLSNGTVLNTDTIHAVTSDFVNVTSNVSIDPKINLKVKNVVSDSDILLNPVGDVVVDPSKILKTVNIRSISDVVPITMSSDVNIGSIGTDTKTLNTDHIRQLTAGGRTDFEDVTIDDLKVATITPSVGGMTIDMNTPSITSATQINVDADLKVSTLTTNHILPETVGMALDLSTSNISSPLGVRISNVTSQDTTFNSITPIAKALAVNGDIKMLQDASVYTDNLNASVAQNITVNSDMLINPVNTLKATNIDAVAVNNKDYPYGMKMLLDQSTITSGSDILVTPNNLFKVYGPIQCDSYQPLTIGGDIMLTTIPTAKVITNNLQVDKLSSNTGNSLIIASDGNISLNTPSGSKMITNNVEAGQLASATDNDLVVRGRRNLGLFAGENILISATTENSGLINILGTGLILQANNMTIGKVGSNYTTSIISDQVSLDASNSLFLGLDYTSGKTVIGNRGIQFGSLGNALLNAYEVNTYTGTFSNMTTTATSFTIRFTKIGNVVTVSLDTPSVFSTIQNISGATFSVNIDSKYRKSTDVILPAIMQDVGGGSTPFRIRISVLGYLTIMAPSNVVGTQYLMFINGSYIVA